MCVKTKVIPLLALFVIVAVFLYSQGQVKDTRHNLSVSGPGQYRSLDETEICKFCHTPHSANPRQPLWNHQLSAVTHYRTYRSATFEAAITGEAPVTIDGNSRLCLSCHDGTVALGAILNNKSGAGFKEGLGALPPTARGYIGTDLSGSHPVSFEISEALIARNNARDSLLNSLAAMKSDPDVQLDEHNKMQCSSCHDVHSDKHFASSGIHFWAKPTFNDVCIVCHRL
jgi:hypothetical protein